MPASTAARFMLSATHWREMSSMGRLRSLEWNEAKSARLSTRSAGIGTSRTLRALLPGASGRTLVTGGSWLSRRSLRQSDRASETRRPVLSMIRKAMRVGKLGAAATRASASSGVK